MSEDLTTGAEPLLGESVVINLTAADGSIEQHKMRRLGVRDVFRIMRIVAAGAMTMGTELNLSGIKQEDMASTMLMLVLLGFPMAENQCIELLADIIGMKPNDLADPDKYSMNAVPEIVAALVQHQDLKAFFTGLGSILALPGMKAASLNLK